MITWMQRHKKWLITTVWVSTIAFVGAGFVGWGSYDFGKSGGTIATQAQTTLHGIESTIQRVTIMLAA